MRSVKQQQEIESIQRESLVSACVLISPDKSDIRIHRSDRCDFASLIFQLQDGWQFFALLGWGRNKKLDGYGIQTWAALEGAEGVSSELLDRAMQAFRESCAADGIWRLKGSAGSA